MTGTTFSLRDLGLSPGQARHDELELALVPYVQGAVDYVDAGGKAPALPPKGVAKVAAEPVGIEYSVIDDKVTAQLDTTAMTEGTSFRLRFQANYTGPCARCLEPAAWTANVDSYAVHDANAPEDDDDLRSEHVDDSTNLLDVSAWAREEVGLLFPTRVLCRKDCRGLCGECGINLNEHPEHAHEKPTDTRWDALKGLQLDGSEE